MTFSASTNNWARNGGTAPLKLPEQQVAEAPEVQAEEAAAEEPQKAE